MTESVYTANDEEPKCGRCDNICESDELRVCKSDNEMLKDVIIRLAMRLVGM